MVNTTFYSSEDMIKKLQSLKCKTKSNFYEMLKNYYDEINIRRQSGTFSINVEGTGKTYHDVLLLEKFL